VPDVIAAFPTVADFRAAHERVREHAYHTPLLSSRSLSAAAGCRAFVKAESLQRTGSYKIRGPLNKLPQLSEAERAAGVVCSSAGNHAQGVALAAALHGIRAVVVMAENATSSKVAATRGYGAEVVQHGSIWDEANEKALELVREEGLTYVHPFDDLDLILGQGTLGLEVHDDLPDVDVVVVPIGGGGLISGVSMALKALKPSVRVIGVESAGAPAMKRSVEAGRRIVLDQVTCRIDGLVVKQVGENTLEIVSRFVDEIVTMPDEQIYEALIWTLSRTKIVVEGAAAAPVAALLQGLVDVSPDDNVVCVLSGGNVNLDQLRGLPWN
jgi:threonine dehydratase